MIPQPGGRIITFYSYKGGTGRSMALANVAWLLASRGRRVLAIDWDLEAPGLHRYLEPFLADKLLEKSTGLIDFVLEFASAAVMQTKEEAGPDWHLEYANIRAHAIPVEWDFSGDGLLHLVPAGRQDAAYPVRVNAFDWRQFYEKLGGGVWLEAVKQQMRQNYDYILIDSRTGVSDTSGICTVQMPDELVVCFTLNNQSTRGASAVAYSALQQRRVADRSPSLRVWPVPMRVESAEQERLHTARALARTRFSRLMEHLPPALEDVYWGEMEIFYFPLYAYDELLATFGDRPRQSSSLLASVEKLVSYLAPGDKPGPPMPEDVRVAGWRKFTTQPAADALEDLKLIGEEYERIRKRMEAGNERTYLMTALLERAALIAGQDGVAQVSEALFKANTDGSRVLGLGLAARDPRRSQVDMSLEGIGARRSPFEQYHALVLAARLLPMLDPTAKKKLQDVIQTQIDKQNISPSDQSRWITANGILTTLQKETRTNWTTSAEAMGFLAGAATIACVEVRPSSEFLHYEDIDERHGPWVGTRQTHSVTLPRIYWLGRDPVTNADFREFVKAGGYEHDEFWSKGVSNRQRLLASADGKSLGPAAWARRSPPSGKDRHPVTGICYYEAMAFIRWLQREAPVPGWIWTLPREDEWEYVARTEVGLIYPWGDAFDSSKCNSVEAGIGDTSEVDRFTSGASRHGCRNMAGNVWEFVEADGRVGGCVLRGGSYKNDRFEVRSYLRLFGVPPHHRPPDFGFRVAQEEPLALRSPLQLRREERA